MDVGFTFQPNSPLLQRSTEFDSESYDRLDFECKKFVERLSR